MKNKEELIKEGEKLGTMFHIEYDYSIEPKLESSCSMECEQEYRIWEEEVCTYVYENCRTPDQYKEIKKLKGVKHPSDHKKTMAILYNCK